VLLQGSSRSGHDPEEDAAAVMQLYQQVTRPTAAGSYTDCCQLLPASCGHLLCAKGLGLLQLALPRNCA
jgi:hypothetical protein